MTSRPGRGASVSVEGDLACLRFTTVAVVAGLLAAGFVAFTRDHGPSGAGPGRASRAAAMAPDLFTGGRAGPATVGPARTGSAGTRPAGTGSVGLRLLREAAIACLNVPYQGVQLLAWWRAGGPGTSVVDVWHRPGGATLTVPAVDGPDQSPGHAAALAGPDTSAPQGVLGVSQQLVLLLGANYVVTAAGRGEADGRPAQIVAVRRSGGGLAARFWLDTATKLPLRREIFDTRARLVSEDAFIDLRIGTPALAGMPAPGARAWGARLAASQLAGLRAHGWPLPGPLPSGLSLFDARETGTASGPVIEESFSDGLSVVSLFVQRGHLPEQMNGWSQVAMAGHRVYADDPDDLDLAWSAGGFVFTVIADAPQPTVGQVVAALPHDRPPGLLARMAHGLRRLVSWASPFG